MKANTARAAIGEALPTASADGGKLMVFVNPNHFIAVATILQNNPSQYFIGLNMTDASALHNLVVTYTLLSVRSSS